jgi:hypothetical protein
LAALGRACLLRGELDTAADWLQASIDLAQRHHWLSFVPWPQAFLGEVHLLRDDRNSASETLRQAFARACQVGDPCWEGVSARGLGLVAAAAGDIERAFGHLTDAPGKDKPGKRCVCLARCLHPLTLSATSAAATSTRPPGAG